MTRSISSGCLDVEDESGPVDSAESSCEDVCLQARGVSKTFRADSRDVLALDDVDLSVFENEFFCLLGPSGCGKTTLLRIISGLVDEYDGAVEIHVGDEEDRMTTNMVFQEQGIFPWKTVIENVAFGLKVRGVPRDERRRRAEEYLRKVDLEDFAAAYPHQLSGGMKQRVGIARAFVNDPALLLMDEPFGTLDAQTKRVLQQELLSLWNDSKKTVVYVTHDIDEAILLGDRIGVMSARPGEIREIIDVDLDRPRMQGTFPRQHVTEIRERVWDLISSEVERSMGDGNTHGL